MSADVADSHRAISPALRPKAVIWMQVWRRFWSETLLTTTSFDSLNTWRCRLRRATFAESKAVAHNELQQNRSDELTLGAFIGHRRRGIGVVIDPKFRISVELPFADVCLEPGR